PLATAAPERWPTALATGIPLGLMVIKPQLALALPVALLVLGRWRSLATAAATAAIAALLTTLALGAGVWSAFLDATAIAARDYLRTDALDLHATLRGALATFGVPGALATAAQAALSLAVLATLVATLGRRLAGPATVALIAYATIAVSPRVMEYDLLILVVGALAHARHLAAQPTRPMAEQGAIALALVLSAADFVLGLPLAWAAAPLLLAALLLAERTRYSGSATGASAA
ncbi:MAG: glycosyltransferase 87 family protein, partial [Pseudomonadota bacterium]